MHARAGADPTARSDFAADDRISLAEASALARRDRKTLMKDIAEGRFPNAVQAATGRRAWTLLVQDLLDANLVQPEQVAPPRQRGMTGHELTADQRRVIELEAQLRAQEEVTGELRAEVARLHELAMAMIAQLSTGSRVVDR